MPAFTAAPDRTKICVMMPSTCGRTSVERRDFNTATNSELMVTGFGASTSTPTGNAGVCCGPVGWPLRAPYCQDRRGTGQQRPGRKPRS